MAVIEEKNKRDVDNDWSLDTINNVSNGDSFKSRVADESLNIKPLAIDVANPINYNSFSNSNFSVMYNSKGTPFQPDSGSVLIPVTDEELSNLLNKLASFDQFSEIPGPMFNYKTILSSRSDFERIRNECKFLSGGLLIKKGIFDYKNCKISVTGYSKFVPCFNDHAGGGYKLISTLIKPNPNNKVNLEFNPSANMFIYYIILKTYLCTFFTGKHDLMDGSVWPDYEYRELDDYYSFLSSSNEYLGDLVLCDGLNNYDNKPYISTPLIDVLKPNDMISNDLNCNITFDGANYQFSSEITPNRKRIKSDTFLSSSNSADKLVGNNDVFVCETAMYDSGYIYFVLNDGSLRKASITNYDFMPVASFNPTPANIKSDKETAGWVLASSENQQVNIESESWPIDKYTCPSKSVVTIEYNGIDYVFIVSSYYGVVIDASAINTHVGHNCEIISKGILEYWMREWRRKKI